MTVGKCSKDKKAPWLGVSSSSQVDSGKKANRVFPPTLLVGWSVCGCCVCLFSFLRGGGRVCGGGGGKNNRRFPDHFHHLVFGGYQMTLTHFLRRQLQCCVQPKVDFIFLQTKRERFPNAKTFFGEINIRRAGLHKSLPALNPGAAGHFPSSFCSFAISLAIFLLSPRV